MANINVTVQFDGILPAPDWRYVFLIERNGTRDIFLSKSETPSAPDGWVIVEGRGRINVGDQALPAGPKELDEKPYADDR